MGLIDIILIAVGFYTLFGVLFKPRIFWHRGRIFRTRQLIGDRSTEIIYIITALLLLGVGIWSAAGGWG